MTATIIAAKLTKFHQMLDLKDSRLDLRIATIIASVKNFSITLSTDTIFIT
jgi:hypothetical protein